MITFLATAWGAACCVGSTSTVPTRLGECEHTTLGISFTGESAIGRWDRAGARRRHPSTDRGIIGMLGGGVRLNRQFSLNGSLPVRLNDRGASTWGGGVGDVSAVLLWDPLEERYKGPPVLLLTGGFRASTGRDWAHSKSAKGEDVTGLPGTSLRLGAQLERTLNSTPWSVGILGDVPVGSTSPASVTLNTSVGRYVATSWSVLGGLRHTMAGFGATRSHRTVASVRLVHGRPLTYRFYAGLESDVPIAQLGRSNTQYARASFGAVWVH